VVRTLGALGERAASARSELKELAAGSDQGLALSVAAVLTSIGEDSVARDVARRLLGSPTPAIRLQAAERLTEWNDAAGVPILRAALTDTAMLVKARAASALSRLGPGANAAVPDLTRMLSDTALRLFPSPGGGVLESPAALAAWALSRIMPTRSDGAGGSIEYPAHVQLEAGHSLRDDGLGIYAWGVDSVTAVRNPHFALMLSSFGRSERGPIGRVVPGFRRSLLFDLSRPVAPSGAVERGTVADNEAYVWIWRGRDPAGHLLSFSGLTPSDSSYPIARIELRFRIDGILHGLQLGPMVEGQGGGVQWYTGIHGNGTSMGNLTHPTSYEWIIRTPPGSRARLWSFEDRAHPVDRGLYEFSLAMRFLETPTGPDGLCLLNPSSCWRRWHE
jgi:hypothetical protein